MDVRMINILGSGDTVVDLGCGSGQLLDDLESQFVERIGLDVSRQRLTSADDEGDGWRFQEADLNARFPLQDASADALIANQVIEHIIDPRHFAREIYRVLRPGGRCAITTPNVRYLKNIAALMFSGYGPRTAGGNTLDGSWDGGHLHYFTHKDLRELFSQSGFRQVHSHGLIELNRNSQLRSLMDHGANTYPIREFLSGCILLWAVK